MSGRYPNEAWAFNQRQTVAYKGYLVTPTMGGQFTIQKDKAHISYAASIDDAKRIIDEIAL